LDKIFICPLCGLEREQKKQIDFHLKYGHPELHDYIEKEVTRAEMEKKLEELKNQKNLLDKEINLMQTIIEKIRED
jgi:cell division protein FtsB